nr:IclR family transcriptional regulator C-terminal domain-containing protein [Companilactobacillus zhachilii]
MGKALLADKTSNDLDSYFSETTLNPITKYTITSISKLNEQINLIKNRGYSIDDKENQEEVICVGATLKKNNKVFGAFSVSTPEYRLDDNKLKKIINNVLETKNKIENEL